MKTLETIKKEIADKSDFQEIENLARNLSSYRRNEIIQNLEIETEEFAGMQILSEKGKKIQDLQKKSKAHSDKRFFDVMNVYYTNEIC